MLNAESSVVKKALRIVVPEAPRRTQRWSTKRHPWCISAETLVIGLFLLEIRCPG